MFQVYSFLSVQVYCNRPLLVIGDFLVLLTFTKDSTSLFNVVRCALFDCVSALLFNTIAARFASYSKKSKNVKFFDGPDQDFALRLNKRKVTDVVIPPRSSKVDVVPVVKKKTLSKRDRLLLDRYDSNFAKRSLTDLFDDIDDYEPPRRTLEELAGDSIIEDFSFLKITSDSKDGSDFEPKNMVATLKSKNVKSENEILGVMKKVQDVRRERKVQQGRDRDLQKRVLLAERSRARDAKKVIPPSYYEEPVKVVTYEKKKRVKNSQLSLERAEKKIEAQLIRDAHARQKRAKKLRQVSRKALVLERQNAHIVTESGSLKFEDCEDKEIPCSKCNTCHGYFDVCPFTKRQAHFVDHYGMEARGFVLGMYSQGLVKNDDRIEAQSYSVIRGLLDMVTIFDNADLKSLLSTIENYDQILDRCKILFLLTHSVRKSDSVLNTYTLIYLYFSIHMKSAMDKTIFTSLFTGFILTLKGGKRLLANAFSLLGRKPTPDIMTESLSSVMFDISNNLSSIVESDVCEAIRNLVISSAALKFFDKTIAMEIYKYFGKPSSLTFPELLKLSFDSVAKIIRAGEMIASGVPICEALFSPNAILMHNVQTKELMAYKDHTYTGLPREGCLDRKLFISRADSYISFYDKVLTKMSPLSKDYRVCFENKLALIDATISMKSSMAAMRRQTPIGVLIYSPPGVGKSNILEYIAKVHSDVKGRKFDFSHIFTRNMTSAYWENYQAYSQPYVHYSELGNKTSKLASSQGDPMISELTSVIDSLPYSLDMAFGDKGKAFCLAEMVLVDTNNPDLNLDYVINNKAAFKRRFIHIHPSVKEEYRLDGTPMIDFNKCSEGAFMDRWLFDVRTYRAISATESISHDHMTGKSSDDIYRLTEVLTALFSDHIEKEDSISKKVNDGSAYEGYNMGFEFPHSDVFSDVKTESRDFSEVVVRHVANQFSAVSSSFSTDAKLLFEYIKGSFNGFCGILSTSFFYFFLYWFCSSEKSSSAMLCFTWFRLLLFLISASVLLCIDITWILALFLFCFLFVDLTNLAKRLLGLCVKDAKSRAWSSLLYYYDTTKSYVMCENKVVWSSPETYVRYAAEITSCVAVVAIIVSISNLVFSFTSKSRTKEDLKADLISLCDEDRKEIISEVATSFIVEDSSNIELNAIEEKSLCTPSYERIPNKVVTQWNVKQSTESSKHTSDMKSLAVRVLRNVRRCIVRSSDRTSDTYLLGVKGNCALINTHSLGKNRGEVRISVSTTGDLSNDAVFRDTFLTDEEIIDLGNDVTAVLLGGVQFLDILQHIGCDSIYPSFSPSMIGYTNLVAYYKEDPITVRDSVVGEFSLDRYFSYEWTDHKEGKCGMPLIIKKDSGSAIVGIHLAGDRNSNVAFATPIVRDKVQLVYEELVKRSGFPVICSQSGRLISPTTLPISKSPFRYEILHGLNYYGKLEGDVLVNNDSRLKKTFLESKGILGEVFFDVLSFIPDIDYVPPMMKPIRRDGKYISPYNIALVKMSSQKKSLNRRTLRKVVDLYTQRIISGLSDRIIGPLTVEVAINGAEYDTFLRRISASKAAGFQWHGPKSNHIPLVYDTLREPTSDLKLRLLEMLNVYASGESFKVVYKAQLKDEPRSREKAESGKTRVFFMSPLDYLILCRMYLGPIYTLVVEKFELFCTSIGIDMHRDPGRMYVPMVEFSTNIMEGDYSSYDTSMPSDIGWAANAVVYNVAKSLGYNDYALTIVSGLLTDNLFPFFVMNLDLFDCPGAQPSGKYATAEDNSIRGVIMLMYAYYSNPLSRGRTFFDDVLPNVFGDDLLASVKDDVSDWFNNHTYQAFCEEHYNIQFTSASKGIDLKKFLSPHEMSFLKRKFRFSESFGRIIAPLELNSVYKTMSWILPSPYVAEQEQVFQIMESSLRELMFHCDRESFDKFRHTFIRSYSDQYGSSLEYTKSLFSTYDGLLSSLKSDVVTESRLCPQLQSVCGGRQSVPYDRRLVECALAQRPNASVREYVCEFRTINLNNFEQILHAFGRVCDLIQWPPNTLDMLRFERARYNTELKQAEEDFLKFSSPMPGVHPNDLPRVPQYHLSSDFRQAADDYRRAVSLIDRLTLSISILDRAINRHIQTDIRSESAVHGEMKDGIVESVDLERHGNVLDTSGEQMNASSTGSIYPAPQLKDTNLELNRFFERPIQLAVQSVSLATDYNYTLGVWSAYFNNPTVRAKLRNYSLLRADLNIRIAVSGTPFHMSKLQIAYIPFDRNNEVAWLYSNDITAARRPYKLKYLSQTPGCKVMDVKDNAPLEVCFPWVSPMPMGRLYNVDTAALADTSTLNDFDWMGTLFIHTINKLQSVSPTGTAVSFYVYAWLTNVHLGCPTATVMQITTESKDIDERVIGPVEKVASNVVSISKALTSVPILRPYAMASSLMFQGLERLAAHFGWSAPVMITKPNRVKNEPFQNGANTICYDTGKRLTLDPRQELTVDPRVCGTDEDEMALSYICAQESLLYTATWAIGKTPMTSFFDCAVNPRICEAPTKATFVQPTSLAFVSSMFQHWRGDITFRFEFVCTNFHRGKVAIIFEPNLFQNVLINATLELNKQYMYIVDLQETQSVEVCVNWAFPRSWAQVFNNNNMITSVGTISNHTQKSEGANGYITLVPITSLQSPEDVDVPVNIYIRSDNIMFNHLVSTNIPTTDIWAESRDVDNVNEVSCFVLNPTGATMEHISQLHFGETPASLRGLLKRFATTYNVAIAVDANVDKHMYANIPVFPPLAPTPTSAMALFHPTLLSYVRYAYLAMRGGLRKRLRLRGALSSSYNALCTAKVTLLNPSTTDVVTTGFALGYISDRIQGTLTYIPTTNGGIEFEIPFYSDNLFVFSGNTNPYTPGTFSYMNSSGVRSYVLEVELVGATTAMSVVEDTAIADDFSLMRFIAAPPFTI